MTAAQREFESLSNIGELNDDDRRRAARIELRLDPGAQGSSAITIAGDEGLTQSVADSQALISATEEAADAGIAASEEARQQLGAVRTSIANIGDAIQAVDDGALTGPALSRLPSFRESTVRLENARARLGLDVVGASKFGALSKGELDLALSVAVPDRLRPEELKRWLVERRGAQEKLAAELERAAIFLGTPGNTPADWLRLNTSSSGQPVQSQNLSELSDEDLLNF